VAASLALGPFALAAFWMWRSEPAGRRAPLQVLAFGAATAVALNLVLRVGGLNEYKFIFAAGICMAAPAAVGIERVLLKSSRQRWGLLAGLPAVLALVMVSFSANRIPRGGSDAMEILEGSFWLRLAPEIPEAGWTGFVRERTRPDTVVVVDHPDFHTTSFAGRALLVPSEGERRHFGYNIESRFNLLVVRGYSRTIFDERYALLERIYADASSDDEESLLASLETLGRPVAIVWRPDDGRSFLRWLRSGEIGSEVFRDDDGHVVYLLAPRAASDDAGES
jgi:hypothetical protein